MENELSHLKRGLDFFFRWATGVCAGMQKGEVWRHKNYIHKNSYSAGTCSAGVPLSALGIEGNHENQCKNILGF